MQYTRSKSKSDQSDAQGHRRQSLKTSTYTQTPAGMGWGFCTTSSHPASYCVRGIDVEAIKELGTNGGGFLNANSAHPYENPTALTNPLEMIAIFLIPFALTYTFGKMIGDTRQGWVILIAMLVLFVPLVALAYYSEQHGNPLVGRQGIDQLASLTQSGGNMEGKETRFGVAASALFTAVTTPQTAQLAARSFRRI